MTEQIDADPDRPPPCPLLQVIYECPPLILGGLSEAHLLHEPFVVPLGIQ